MGDEIDVNGCKVMTLKNGRKRLNCIDIGRTQAMELTCDNVLRSDKIPSLLPEKEKYQKGREISKVHLF